jgi:hypothetical protein
MSIHNHVECLLSSPSVSVCPYVHMNYSRTNEQLFMKFNIRDFYEELLNHLCFDFDWTVLTTTLHEYQYACLGRCQA